LRFATGRKFATSGGLEICMARSANGIVVLIGDDRPLGSPGSPGVAGGRVRGRV
jgi:hypothetical protein